MIGYWLRLFGPKPPARDEFFDEQMEKVRKLKPLKDEPLDDATAAAIAVEVAATTIL